MDKNQFGKTSKFFIKAVKREEKTILDDVYFTSPYKVMKPFEHQDGSIQVMLLSASAGIMEGDRQDFDFEIECGADFEFVSQSYDKIHKMKTGCAKRNTKIYVQGGAKFRFNPQPTIPFQDSAFESRMEVELEDETAQFLMNEILSCGRAARGEQFLYRHYYNLVEIRRAGTLIYRDNTRYEPAHFDMNGFGMYESYTHLANIFFTKKDNMSDLTADIVQLMEETLEIEGGITTLASGDCAVRIFGRRAQKLEALCKTITELWNQSER